MTTPIQDFIAHIKKHGVAKTNRFRVTFNLPKDLQAKFGSDVNTDTTKLTGGINNSAKVLSLMCQQVTMPGYTTTTQEQNYGSTNRKMPVDKSTSEFDMVFYASGDMMEKKIFDAWKNLIFRPDHTIAFYDRFVTDILVEQMNDLDVVVYQTKVTEAYPCTVNPITLDRSSTNTAMIFQVSFQYRKVKEGADEDSGSVRNPNNTPTNNVPVDKTTVNNSAVPATVLPPANVPGGATQRDVDMYTNLNKIKMEIENGMEKPAANMLLQNAKRDMATNGASPDVVAYADTLIASVKG